MLRLSRFAKHNVQYMTGCLIAAILFPTLLATFKTTNMSKPPTLTAKTFVKPRASVIAISPNGALLAVAQCDGNVKVLETNCLDTVVADYKHPDILLTPLRFAPDGSFLVATSDASTRVWATKPRGGVLHELEFGGEV